MLYVRVNAVNLKMETVSSERLFKRINLGYVEKIWFLFTLVIIVLGFVVIIIIIIIMALSGKTFKADPSQTLI